VRPVEDIISQGGERPPGGPRRQLLIAAAVVVLAGLVLIEHVPRGGHPRPHPSVAGGVQYGGGPALIKLRDAAPHGPSGILGPTLPVAADIRVPRTGAQPDWYWPARGTIEPIGGLPDDRFGYVFTRLAGGWAIQPDPPDPAGCGDCPGPPAPIYYLGNHARVASLVGPATMVAPAATSADLWLTTYPADANPGTTSGRAREYSAGGTTQGPGVGLPVGYTIAQGTTRGLLLAPVTTNAQAPDLLWNPYTGKTVRRFANVLAQSANLIAYTPPCTATCSLHVLNLATGHATVLTMTVGRSLSNASVSPDGRYLALAVSFTEDGDDGALAMQLEVADLRTGRTSLVPDTWVSSDALDGFGWAGDGDNLVAELTFSTRVQLALWNPARSSLAVADVRPAAEPAALVVG
jgi:hypothetical protein